MISWLGMISYCYHINHPLSNFLLNNEFHILRIILCTIIQRSIYLTFKINSIGFIFRVHDILCSQKVYLDLYICWCDLLAKQKFLNIMPLPWHVDFLSLRWTSKVFLWRYREYWFGEEAPPAIHTIIINMTTLGLGINDNLKELHSIFVQTS